VPLADLGVGGIIKENSIQKIDYLITIFTFLIIKIIKKLNMM
jgi:hypothetical protein